VRQESTDRWFTADDLFSGTKSSVYTHTNYLVIISPPFIPTATSASATVRNFVARGQPQPNTDIVKVTVFDPENKLVAFSETFVQGVREVVSQWGDIYILSNDGKVSLRLFPPFVRLIGLALALTSPGEAHGCETGYALQEIAIPHRTKPRQDAESG
jgi:hypothetical protein